MGNYVTRRQNSRIEEVDSSGGNQAYLYPPKAGNYFSSHFIMGGERFETCLPETYLFGENLDLNFLGGKPTPFPYSAPLPHEPTRTLRSLVNIRKESLRFVKVIQEVAAAVPQTPVVVEVKPPKELAATLPPSKDSHTRQSSISSQRSSQRSSVPSQAAAPVPPPPPPKVYQYNIEFTFDTDVKCAITIHYFATEEITSHGVVYTSRDPTMNSETYYYKRGVNQQFNQVLHVFEPTLYDEDDLMYRAFDEQGNFDTRVPFPVVIHCVAQEGDEPRQSHALIAVVERNHDGSFSIKPFKQKMFIDGLYYLLQEIYGIENKNVTTLKSGEQYISPEDDIDDNGSECVICMSDSRDTLILPCRHLCLCNACADSLRYQANNCPICRSPFRALLQIRAVRKTSAIAPINAATGTPPSLPSHQLLSGSTTDLVDIPPGYEPFSLLEALNGPNAIAPPPISSHGMYTFKNENSVHADNTPRGGRRSHHRREKRDTLTETSSASLTTSSRGADGASPSTPEVVVSAQPVSPDKAELGHAGIVSQGVEKWRVPQPRHVRHEVSAEPEITGHESSASSTSSTGVAHETRRLLPDCDDEIVVTSAPRPKRTSESDKGPAHGRPSSFKQKGKSSRKVAHPPRSLSHETPGSGELSPTTVGPAGSYAMMSLHDGFDEQKCMTDTDLMSVTTGSVANMTYVTRIRDDDGEDLGDDDIESELFHDASSLAGLAQAGPALSDVSSCLNA